MLILTIHFFFGINRSQKYFYFYFQHEWFFGSWDQDDHVPVDEQSETPTNPSVTRLSCDDDGKLLRVTNLVYENKIKTKYEDLCNRY